MDNDALDGGLASGRSRLSFCSPDDAIVVVDNGGVITAWNPAAEKLFGYPADAAVGQPLTLIIPPKHLLRHINGFHKAMDAARLVNGGRPTRVTGTSADGRLVPLTMTLSLSNPSTSLWDPSRRGALRVMAVLRRAGYSGHSFS